ncbi:hypothetical protein SAMN05443252_105202 [Bacillus sp. OV322]|uniref:hypothetical protein n=1 Tax=Bacillus sp. OV322 TaxID=1882764 RepID=UPI0008E28CCC|nr:hypothetical protein SAMN05443252_105202 [Bacillus sp. OV322]
MSWNIIKVTKVFLIADHTKKESDIWYKMEISTRVNDTEKNNKECFDTITLRVDIPNMFKDYRYRDTDSKMNITLIKYESIKTKG